MSSGNLDEIQKAAMAYRVKMEKAVFIDEGHIIIKVELDGGQLHEYDIEVTRCDTPEKILAWCEHLTEKTWMNLPLMRRFIYVAHDANGLTMKHV